MGLKEIEPVEAPQIITHRYSTPSEAQSIYESLSSVHKLGMASVYREAFGGYPWYESVKCNSCGEFARETGECTHCHGRSFSEAYPMQWLTQEYFPHMVAQYTPGVLITLNQGADMIGFSTGGAIALGELITDKYKGDPKILASIVRTAQADPRSIVFYENETCISASLQQKGSGGQLNLTRVQAASALGFQLICGRTINQPWLKLKERQLALYGYDFISFNPEGDDYEVDGVKRQFFMAKRKTQ